MDPITLSVLLGGLGLVGGIGKQNAQRAQNEAAVEQTRYSPWSKMGMGKTQDEEAPIGSALGGALSGYSLGKNIESTDAWNKALRDNIWARVGSLSDSGLPGRGVGSERMAF